MFNNRWTNWLRRTKRALASQSLRGRNRSARFETLSPRLTPTVTASFTPAGGVLTVFGDNLDNNIVVSRNAAGALLVNGGAVAVQGGTPTVANTALVQIFGQAGNDTLSLNEANGALPKANIFGGADNDVLTGGSGADLLFGQAGNDTLFGKGGADLLFGGADNDTLTGGDADDQVFGESGNDRMIWNPGDDTDLNEGGDGTDTVEVNGGNGAEVFTATANGTRVRFDRLNPAPFSIDIGTSENLVLNANGGDDSFSATGNLAALIKITVDGGTGNDTLLGGNGVDTLFGGDGDDFIDGNQGNDTAFLGAGNDVFQWDPGDGSDTVEGQDGADKLLFNGANIGEKFDVSPNGGRVRFTRDIGNIVMDLNDVEAIDLNKRSGLYLTFYSEGDKRERGSSLVRLKQLYRAAGLPLEGTELPDYLPVMLEFAAAAPDGRGEIVLRENRAALDVDPDHLSAFELEIRDRLLAQLRDRLEGHFVPGKQGRFEVSAADQLHGLRSFEAAVTVIPGVDVFWLLSVLGLKGREVALVRAEALVRAAGQRQRRERCRQRRSNARAQAHASPS